MSKKSVITFFGFYVINQDEVGVKLTLGKFTGLVEPGLGFCIPILQKVITTKSSIQTVDLPEQQVVLSGNIAVTISGTLHYRIIDSQQALLEVSDYMHSIRQLALTTISDVMGTKSIEQVRSSKPAIAEEIEKVIRKTSSKWGIADVDIRLTDASMDPNLLRAMMRETEANKEASAQKIKAEADQITAKIFSEAAKALANSPGAMTLRVLQTLSDISSDKSTVVVPIPIELTQGITQVKEKDAQQKPTPVLAEIQLSENQLFCFCPACNHKYKVTDVAKDERYDKQPEIPGHQLSCGRCHTMFSIPKLREA